MTNSQELNATPAVVRLTADHREAFLRFVADYEAHERSNMNFLSYRHGRDNFEAYVQHMAEEERGENLQADGVPCSHRWLLNEGEIVGVVRIRHNIESSFLQEIGGHIGYDVPPAHRGHGYGTACLRVGLRRAQELGIPRVLLTCSADNAISQRVIERCGGRLQDERFVETIQRTVRRYWIDTRGILQG